MAKDSVKISPADARETYEMLRAAHTLLRMSFGAVALLCTDKEDAEKITTSFDSVFKLIAEYAGRYLEISGPEKDEPAN